LVESATVANECAYLGMEIEAIVASSGGAVELISSAAEVQFNT
jgi:hypothetical protein